jgi:ElaB/YqjD/DUF883 family membrane-anchored ribosome-binding protein
MTGPQTGPLPVQFQAMKDGTVSQTVLDRTAERVGESARQASPATSRIADAIIDDGVGVVTRAAKQCGDAAEGFLNDTSQRIRRHPALTVGVTFAVGFTAGALIEWMITRR